MLNYNFYCYGKLRGHSVWSHFLQTFINNKHAIISRYWGREGNTYIYTFEINN